MFTETRDAPFWDRIAPDYAKRPFPDPAATTRKLDVIRAGLRPGARVLDVGCGTGMFTLELAPHVAQVDGVDVSPAMVALATQRAAAAGVANVRFRAEPAGTLASVPDASVDCVLLFNLLHLVPDPGALLRAARRVLVSGGLLATSTPCLGGSWFPPYALLLPVARWLGKAPHVTLLTPEGLRALHAEAGFVALLAPAVGGDPRGLFVTARAP